MERLSLQLSGNPASPALLFIHGFLGSSIDWDPFINELSKSYYCIAVDLPAHGESKHIKAESIPKTADLIKELLDELKLDKVITVGYSLGGRVAIAMLDQFPERIEKSVLLSASPGLDNEKDRLMRQQIDRQLSEKLTNGGFTNFLKDWYELPLFDQLRECKQFASMLANRLDNDPALIAESIVAFSPGVMPSYWESVYNSEVPIYYIAGEEDMQYSSTALKVSTGCSTAEVNVLKGCGHTIFIERPKLFMNLLKAYLAKEVNCQV